MKKRICIKVSELIGIDPRLNAVKALDNFWWCDQNSLNHAPDLFTGNETIAWKSETDFPVSENPLKLKS